MLWSYNRMKMGKVYLGLAVFALAPYVYQRFYWYADRLPYWNQRIERGLLAKESFDFMLRVYAEKEDDLITEYSDF